jgi:hypothetical protein
MTRRFQFSLRTSIVMMLIAGVFVGANIIPQEMTNDEALDAMFRGPLPPTSGEPGEPSRGQWKYGWPAIHSRCYEIVGWRHCNGDYWSMGLDVGCLLLVLASAWIVLERPLRKGAE